MGLLVHVLANMAIAQTIPAEQQALTPAEAQSSNEVSEPSSTTAVRDFDRVLQDLPTAKLKQLAPLLVELEQLDAKRALPLFSSLIEGALYYRKDSGELIVAQRAEGSTFQLSDWQTGSELGTAEKSSIRKVKTNNRLRKQLRVAIARLTLFADDSDMRLQAVVDMMQTPSTENTELLKQAQLTEKNGTVQNKIKVALALAALDSDDVNQRLRALEDLQGSLEPVVSAKINALLQQTGEDQFAEPSARVREVASKTLEHIQARKELSGYIERIFFGLSLGSILLLVAAGLAITFGVMGVINMAHGELIMLGAYTTYVVQLLMPQHIEYSLFVAIPAAFIVSGLVGIAIERGVIQFLKGRPLETLLATFGISLILQQLVRTIFSPLNRQVSTPEFMSGAMQINPVLAITYNRIYILIFSLLVFAVLLLILKRTSLGLYVRAVSQNRDMARAMGIRSEWVDAMTFGLGSGVAGLAGVALSQVTNVGPNLGQAYIIDSFMVVVFGGVGNLWGTLVGAFALGSLNKFLEPATGAVLANIIVLVGIILFIQKKPRGLFPQRGRAAES